MKKLPVSTRRYIDVIFCSFLVAFGRDQKATSKRRLFSSHLIVTKSIVKAMSLLRRFWLRSNRSLSRKKATSMRRHFWSLWSRSKMTSKRRQKVTSKRLQKVTSKRRLFWSLLLPTKSLLERQKATSKRRHKNNVKMMSKSNVEMTSLLASLGCGQITLGTSKATLKRATFEYFLVFSNVFKQRFFKVEKKNSYSTKREKKDWQESTLVYSRI